MLFIIIRRELFIIDVLKVYSCIAVSPYKEYKTFSVACVLKVIERVVGAVSNYCKMY